jgi:hypothetical protein
MCSGGDVSEDDALEIAAGDTVVIKKYVITVLCKVLKNRERPRDVGAAITEKDGFLDAFHTGANATLTRKARTER